MASVCCGCSSSLSSTTAAATASSSYNLNACALHLHHGYHRMNSSNMLFKDSSVHISSPLRFNANSTWSRVAVKAASTQPEECNQEDCAPEKEVGKVSMEWKAEDQTKVVGTFPPMKPKKEWTGYVEKDTAGQTNIYAVEPTVYVSESVISSNTAGDSSTGSEQTVLVTVGLALGLIFGAEIVLQGLPGSTNSPSETAQTYDGPSLSYYIQKFKPTATAVLQVPDQQLQAPEPAIVLPADVPAAAPSTP